MGSTITTGRSVGAIQADDGEVYFALFERTYSSNCYPHEPEWGCIGFGTGPEMVRHIFEIASDTCGGMLRGPSRRLTPWGYVASWFKAMAKPHALKEFSHTYNLVDKDRAGYLEITVERLDRCEQGLRDAGHGHIVDALRNEGSYTFSLRRDAPAQRVLGLIGWRQIPYLGDHMPVADELGWKPVKAKQAPECEFPGVYRFFNGDNIIVRKEGRLTMGRWQYAVEGHFVAGYGEMELQAPGHYRAVLKALRQHLDNLAELPKAFMVELDPERVSSYRSAKVQRLWEAMGRERQPLWALSSDEIGELSYCEDSVEFIALSEAEDANQLTAYGQMALAL